VVFLCWLLAISRRESRMSYTILGKCPLCEEVAPLYERWHLYICAKCRDDHPYEAPRLTMFGSIAELAKTWKATVW
jgi:hypothetical protein